MLNVLNLHVLLLGAQSKVIPYAKYIEDENLLGQAEKLDLSEFTDCRVEVGSRKQTATSPGLFV